MAKGWHDEATAHMPRKQKSRSVKSQKAPNPSILRIVEPTKINVKTVSTSVENATFKPEKWSKEMVHQVARNYKTRTSFAKAEPAAYKYARRNLSEQEFNEITSHMPRKSRKDGTKRTKEEVIAIARQFETRNEYLNAERAVYQYGVAKGWHDEATAHMPSYRRKKGATTKEEVLEDARQYETIAEWFAGSTPNYNLAQRAGWLDAISEEVGLTSRYWDRKEGFVYFYHIAGTPFWKIGIASPDRLGLRTNIVASQFEQGAEHIFASYVADASKVEGLLRQFGSEVTREEVDPYVKVKNGVRRVDGVNHYVIDGITEMRSNLTAEDMMEITDLMKSAIDGAMGLYQTFGNGKVKLFLGKGREAATLALAA